MEALMNEPAATDTAAAHKEAPVGLPEDLLDLLNEELSLDPSVTIDADTDLLLTGLIDSLGVIQVVAWIEDELDVSVDPVDVTLENFQTAGRMIRFAATLA